MGWALSDERSLFSPSVDVTPLCTVSGLHFNAGALARSSSLSMRADVGSECYSAWCILVEAKSERGALPIAGNGERRCRHRLIPSEGRRGRGMLCDGWQVSKTIDERGSCGRILRWPFRKKTRWLDVVDDYIHGDTEAVVVHNVFVPCIFIIEHEHASQVNDGEH